MQVIILRGIPGSGKSTWSYNFTKKCAPSTLVYIASADNYHMVDGKYQYDPKNASKAHGNCLRAFAQAVRDGGHHTVIVDNTSTTAWEIAPYYSLALAYGHDVKIVTVLCDFATALKRQTHNVPEQTMWNMYQNILHERLPSHWKHEFFDGNQNL